MSSNKINFAYEYDEYVIKKKSEKKERRDQRTDRLGR